MEFLPVAYCVVALFFEAFDICAILINLFVAMVKNMFWITDRKTSLVSVVFVVSACNEKADKFLFSECKCR